MSAHYSIEYRTHFTQMHQTVIGMIGATEQLVFVQLGTILCFFCADSNDFFQRWATVPGTEWQVQYRDIVIGFSALTGLHYNLENIVVSLLQTREKGYALCCLIPYAQFFLMLFFSSYSSLFKEYTIYFLLLCGVYNTWVTGIFNLNSTARAKFNWIFVEPFVYLFIVFLDASGSLSRQQAISAYTSFFLVTLGRYLVFMGNIVRQITAFMGLRFLRVKDKTAKKQA